jgi:ADP-heptose:LPS heptosyltransferase
VATIDKILIYRAGAIGDTIVAIPAIRSVRLRYPNARFVLMTAGGGEGIVWTDRVLSEFGWFDSVITYSSAEITSLRALWNLVRRVRRESADLVIYLGADKNSGIRILRDRIFFWIAGVREFVSTSSRKVTYWGRLRKDPFLYPNEVDRMLDDMARNGIPSAGPKFDLPIADANRGAVEAILAEKGLERTPFLIAMCPGSKQKIKVWPEDRFQEVGRRLLANPDAAIVIVGGPDEAEVGERLLRRWPEGRAANLAQRLSILDSAELLRRCVFYIGNDTGAMHLAAAVGTRCVAIFAAREPANSWHPYGENHAILRKSVPCQNCYLSECVAMQLRCLRDITVEEVWAACQRMMVYR